VEGYGAASARECPLESLHHQIAPSAAVLMGG
jgi:hypothetical protein